jgi:hypothetical protein
VINVEMIFLYQWRVRVRRSSEGGLVWSCVFNASVLVREGRRQDEALLEDKAEATSSFWFTGKEA